MRRTTPWIIPALAVVAGVALLLPGGLAGAQEQEQEGAPVAGANDCPDSPLAQARQTLKAAWARSNWRSAEPVKPVQAKRLASFRRCLEAPGRRKLSAYAKKRKADFFRHRAYRQVAPYRGFSDRGYWLRWLAIPAGVVVRESAGSWTAYNPSGACGPYQLLGWTSCATGHWRDKLRHHRMAAYVLRVQGPGAWVAW